MLEIILVFFALQEFPELYVFKCQLVVSGAGSTGKLAVATLSIRVRSLWAYLLLTDSFPYQSTGFIVSASSGTFQRRQSVASQFSWGSSIPIHTEIWKTLGSGIKRSLAPFLLSWLFQILFSYVIADFVIPALLLILQYIHPHLLLIIPCLSMIIIFVLALFICNPTSLLICSASYAVLFP